MTTPDDFPQPDSAPALPQDVNPNLAGYAQRAFLVFALSVL